MTIFTDGDEHTDTTNRRSASRAADGRSLVRVRPDGATAIVLAPALALGAAVVAAVIRARADGWYPVGDNAFFALRSRDVFTEHHPLLGTWTSASQTLGFDVNNPGPLLFDVLAIPAKLDPRLLPAGVAALVVGSVLAMAVCASRVAGRRGVVLALFGSAGLAVAMGPELLVDPWQPHSLLFPFLAAIVATWATWAGSDGSLIVVAASGSLLVQTHLSYGPVLAVLGLSAAIAVAVRWRMHPRRRGRIRRVAAGAALLTLVLWAQPLAEQLTADGEGNLERLVDASTTDRDESIGPALGVEIAGTLLSPLPAWLPPSFDDDFQPVLHEPASPPTFVDGPSRSVAAASLAATVLALVAVGTVAWRRRIWTLASGAGVALVTVAVSTATVMTIPLQSYGLAPHHVRFLWPASILVTAVLLATVLGSRRGPAIVAGMAVVLSVLSILPRDAAVGPESDDYSAPVITALAPQLDALRGRGPLLFDPRFGRIFEPYSTPVILELERRGIDVVVEDSGLVRQLGPAREADGDERGRFFVWEADLALDGRPGFEQIALVEALDGAERRELSALTSELSRWFRSGEVTLTEDGRSAVRSGRLRDIASVIGGEDDPLAAYGMANARAALSRGHLEVPGHEASARRWVELRTRFARETVAVWVDWHDDAVGASAACPETTAADVVDCPG